VPGAVSGWVTIGIRAPVSGSITPLTGAGVSPAARLVATLGPAEPYKQPFVDRFEPLYEGIGLPRGFRGRIAAAAHAGGIRVRSNVKRNARLRAAYVSIRAALPIR